jgi:hypothetical protein
MQTIRRLYLYAVSLVCLETVLWGSIGLLRSFFSGGRGVGEINQLAGALSLILVGAPVLALHGWLAQRAALRDEEERSSFIRAVFLYGALLLTLLPVAQNAIALLNRLLLDAFGVPLYTAMFGGGQTWSDNLVAILANGIAAGLIYYVVYLDWRAGPLGDDFPEVRRLYRYLWLVYATALVIFGTQQFLAFLLPARQDRDVMLLANGLTLLCVGAPIWWSVARLIRRSLIDPAERDSLLRLAVLYALVFASAASVLVSSIFTLAAVLEFVLGIAFGGMIYELSQKPEINLSLSVALSFGIAWLYYGRTLNATIMASEAAATVPERAQLRRAGLRRLYCYVLALFGLASTVIGLHGTVDLALQVALGPRLMSDLLTIAQAPQALSFLLIGVPLWVFAWRPMQAEAAGEGEVGDHARRSVLRKGYLFLVLFAGVIGVMVGAGMLIYQVLRALLGDIPENLLLLALQQTWILILYAGVLFYHWRVLRADGRTAQRSLARRHAQFPVLILSPDEENFADEMVGAFKRQAPDLPVAVHPYSQGVPDETLSAARAVILPSELVARPSEAIRLWLQSFDGARLVIPTPTKGWYWPGGSSAAMGALARQAASLVRQLAEGEDISPWRRFSPWLVVLYVFAGLFALGALLAFIGALMSFLNSS